MRRVHRTSIATLAAAAMLTAAVVIAAPAQAEVNYGRIGSLSRELTNPVGVTVNPESGDVYVASVFTAVQEFGAGGEPLAHFGEAALSGAAVDPANGNLYVVSAEAQKIETYSPSGKGPLSSFSIEGSANLFGALTVVQIASDAVGDVYLPNAPNNEVQKFSPSGTLLQTITGSGANTLSEPTGVAVDTDGNIYVADRGHGRVEEFNSAGAFVMALGTGVDQTTGGDICTAASRDVCGPGSDGTEALAVDEEGDVLAGDTAGGFHVVVYSPTGAKLADFGQGTIGTSELETINTLTVAPGGLVYVADGGNNVVWVYARQSAPELLETSSFAVTQSSAMLKAEINPDNLDTTYHFQYGVCATPASCQVAPYTTNVPEPDGVVGNGDDPEVVSQELTGLQPDATYHYRVVATNAGGEATGSEQVFTTSSSQPPVVSTGSALGVAQNAATLTGVVETKGFQTEYEFDFGTDTGYGSRIFGDAGGEPGTQAFTAPLQGLAPGTTYHYRIAATNIFGTAYGADQTFTTSAYPTSVLTPPSPPPLIPAILLAPAPSSTTTGVSQRHTRLTAHGARRGTGRKRPKHKASRHGHRRPNTHDTSTSKGKSR